MLWRPGAADPAIQSWQDRPALWAMAVGVIALCVYCVVARHVLAGRPLLVDEIAQLFQAQIYAGGSLSRPAFPHPEFFSGMHIVDTQGRVYSQFPAGGPAMLALGVLVGAPWLVGPCFGVLAIVAFLTYTRITERRPGVALGATLIFAFAPFAVFMSGSHMNHVTSLAWIMVAIAAMAGVMTSEVPRPAVAAVCGFGFGMAATIRPVDAFAFALPAGIWFLLRALRDRHRWKDALPAGFGVAVPMVALLWVNARTTGSPLLFGYEVLWGNSHRLGFHAAPWGMSHTPARGLELINIYFLRLQTYFLETPIPSLVPAIVAIALAERMDRFDRYLLVSSALLVLLYFAYWHDGFYLGPRFMYPLLAPLALWTARVFPETRDRFGSGLAHRAVVYSALCAVAIALTIDLPIRVKQYQGGLLTMRWNADRAAADAGIQNALILVRESWGAQLVARLWALGVPRSETELVYRRTDACILEHAVEKLERDGIYGMAAFEALRPLLSDSARLVSSPASADTTEQYLPGSRYAPRCIARIAEDRGGFTLFTPLLLAHGGGNIYVRDLHARDTLLLKAYPNRDLYLLKPESDKEGELPRFYPLSHDSLDRAWHEPAP